MIYKKKKKTKTESPQLKFIREQREEEWKEMKQVEEEGFKKLEKGNGDKS